MLIMSRSELFPVFVGPRAAAVRPLRPVALSVPTVLGLGRRPKLLIQYRIFGRVVRMDGPGVSARSHDAAVGVVVHCAWRGTAACCAWFCSSRIEALLLSSSSGIWSARLVRVFSPRMMNVTVVRSLSMFGNLARYIAHRRVRWRPI
eukprot:IDg3717t1